MIYVVGDSHTRTFADNINFFPLFLGAGKEVCFISDDRLEKLKHRIKDVVSHIEEMSTIMFVLGEPDTRYYLGKGWTPWAPEFEEKVEEPYKLLDASLKRYETFITWFSDTFSSDFIIFNVIPSTRKQQNQYVRYMNDRLTKFCLAKDVKFINIQSHLIKEGVIQQDYMADVVHLNTSVQPLVEAEIKKLGFPIEDASNATIKASKISRSAFIYNEQFSCYTYQDNVRGMWIQKMIQKVKVFVWAKLNGHKNV